MTGTGILGTISLFIALMPMNQLAPLPASEDFLPEVAETVKF